MRTDTTPKITDEFGDYVSETIADRDRLRERMNQVSSELARMIGYHSVDGAVPVEKLEPLLDQLNPYRAGLRRVSADGGEKQS